MDVAESFGNAANGLGEGLKNLTNNIAGGMKKAFLGSENTKRTLTDAAQRLYDTLDKTAHRTYVNSGFANSQKTKPNNRNIITQTPEMIILIKKRMFSSLDENYRFEFMDKEEKHFIRAAKKLFENKCEDISNYEKLTKLNKIIQENQVINTPIARIIYQTLNALDGNEYNLSSIGSDLEPAGQNKYTDEILKHKNVIKRIRQLLTLNGFNQTTTWVKDSNYEKRNSDGKGTGVIELTLVKSASFTNSLEFEGGRGTIDISDPYRLFFIDEEDVEKAIFQTAETKFNILDTVSDLLEQENDEYKQQLNSLRLSRGASSITYKIDIRTRVYNRVTVILDRIGLELTKADGSGIDYDLLDNENVPSFEQFTSEEKDLLNRIYKNIFKILQNKVNNFEDFRKYNYDVNSVRINMRKNFMGKQLIQPMDTITAFIDSQTVDDKLLSFELQQSFLATSGNTITKALGLPNIAANAASTLGSTNLTGLLSKTLGQINQITHITAEKNILAGADFPDWLYSALRPNFTSQSFGTCVFSGLVSTAHESYNDGVYSLNINCVNNAEYFNQGWINTKPGYDQFNGYLYDPVTPFDFEFDEGNGLLPDVSKFKLLPENVQLVNSGIFKFTDGRSAGQTVTEANFMSADVEPKEGLSKITGTYSNIAKKIFQAPDGFVYKWKKGIGTAIVNQSGTFDGLMSSSLLNQKIANTKEEDAFAGQDLVNVLSILICGEPYNFNTFIKAAFGSETAMNQYSFDASTDYFQGITKLLKKQNKVWGNYLPFKKLDIDPETFGRSMALQLMNFSRNASIRKIQDERASLLDKLMQIEGNNAAFDVSNYSAPKLGSTVINPIKTSNRAVTFNIIKKIVELDAKIQLNEQSIREALSKSNLRQSVVSIGTNLFYDQNVALTGADAKNLYKLTLAKQNELTRRRLWKVKGNTDQNLFIVGSEYDNDFDIQALTYNVAKDYDFINTSWQKPTAKIKEVASVIGMELFVNSQGHIEFRAPRYNRVPSSILFEMFRKKKEYNIQIYPKFLEKTFQSRIESTFNEIEILEDQIRLRGIALGAKYNSGNDLEIESLLNGSASPTVVAGFNAFKFVTGPDGKLTNIRSAVSQINNDYMTAYKPKSETVNKVLGVSLADNVGSDFFERKAANVNNFKVVANTFNNFDIIQQNSSFKSAYTSFNNDKNFYQNQINFAQTIRTRLAEKLNLPVDSASVPTIPQLLTHSSNGKLSAIDVNAIIKQLDGLVTQRYEAILTAVNLVKSLDQASRVNSDDTSTFQKLLMPNIYGEENIPEFLKHMVENELEDDYGFNSGKRYIIKEGDIISMNYREDTPEFTSIIVSGKELGGLASESGGFKVGNAGLSQVWAVDYDMWRMYGSKEAIGKDLPFFSNAESQLAPYAVFLLNQQRANIFRGDVTIRGNEFIQPGEVYYIQERGMLFYSKEVSHSFSYGNGFTTTISLSYGHTPGEYIPTPLDVIGKNVYNGHYLNNGNYRVSRSGTTATDKKQHINTFIYPNLLNSSYTADEELYAGDIGEKNRQVFADIIGKVNLLLEPTIPQINKGTRAITVRIYTDKTLGLNSRLYVAAKWLIKDLIKKGIPASSIVGRKLDSKELIPGEVMIVDFDNKNEKRNPSNLAYSYVKDGNLIKVSDFSASEKDNLNQNSDTRKKFYTSIIDVWLETDIIANEAIVKASSQNLGDTNNSTIKPSQLEQMRQHFDKIEYNSLIQ
jgi:hypothetical protein